MSKPNRLMKIVNTTRHLPAGLQATVLSAAFGRVVPLVGTAGIRYEHISNDKVVCTIKNRRPVQNHIKGVHAAAMALLAETASGFVAGVNIPDTAMPLIKTLKVDYKRVAKGDLKAVATLSAEQQQLIQTAEKGEISVPVIVTDETGSSPIECEMIWAWVPKKRKST